MEPSHTCLFLVQIHQLSFSPHTDSKGIMDLVKFLSPKHVILVHGEKPKMASLKAKIERELGIPSYFPCNNETVSVPSTHYVKADASDLFLRACSNPNFEFSKRHCREDENFGLEGTEPGLCLHVSDERVNHGVLILEGTKKVKLIHQDELPFLLGKEKHDIGYAYCFSTSLTKLAENEDAVLTSATASSSNLLRCLLSRLSRELREKAVQDFGEYIQVDSVQIRVCDKDSCPYRINGCCDKESGGSVFFCCKWSAGDEDLAWKIITPMETLSPGMEA